MQNLNALKTFSSVEWWYFAPFMRGRTLNEAFIILDEAQNTTIPQMKMFLTRLGFASKMVSFSNTLIA
jgi:phosphate starvation-inducible protein PhoH